MEIHGFTTFGIQSSRSSSKLVDGTNFKNLQKIKQNSDQYLQIHSKKKANADSQLNIGDPPDPDPYSQVKSLPFRVKFPTFDGSQVRLWMLRCAEYFDLYPSFSEEEKRELAAMNFVGRAALWYQEFSTKNKYNLLSWISWQQFISIVSARFEDIRIATRADELNQLKYEGNYEDYVVKFEEIRKHVLQIQNKGLLCDNYAYNETYFLMTFLRGLNGKLKSVVSEFNPTNLQQAMDIGRIKIYLGMALEKEVVPLQPLSVEKESFASGLVREEVKDVNASQGVENITTLRKSVIEHNQPSLQVQDTFKGEELKSASNRFESTSLLQISDFEKLQEHSRQTVTSIFTNANISTSTKNPTPSYTGAQTKTKMSLPETGLSSFPLVNLANDEVVCSVRVEDAELVPDTVKKKFLEISAYHGEEVRLSLNMFNFASPQRTFPARSFTNTIKSQNIKTHLDLPERKFPQVYSQLLMETQIGGLHDSNSPYEWGEIYLPINNKEQRISHLISCEEERIAFRKHMEVMIDSSKDFKQHDQLSIFPLGEVAELCSLEHDTVYGNDMEEIVNSALYWDINWWEIGKMNLSLEMVITSYGSGVVVNENSFLYTKSGKIICGCKESDNNFSNDSPKAYSAIDFLRMEGLMELFEATTYYCVTAAKFNMLQSSQISEIQAGKAYFHNQFRQKEFRWDKLLYHKLQLHEKNFVDFTTKAKSSLKWFAKL